VNIAKKEGAKMRAVTLLILIIVIFLVLLLISLYKRDKKEKKVVKDEKHGLDIGGALDKENYCEEFETIESMELDDLETELLCIEKDRANGDGLKNNENINKPKKHNNYRKVFKNGTMIGGKYRTEKILGEGGMGRVYLCKNVELGNYCAIKHFYNGKLGDRVNKAEKEILIKLNHMNLPKIVDVFSDEYGEYIVQTYVEGSTLQKKMEEEGPFDENDVVKWGMQLAKVLDYLHNIKPKQIIYRDMKPSNVIISPEGEAILIDFGIASEREHENDDGLRVRVAGITVEFAAPEQKNGVYNRRTDVFNLGMMMHYLLTNRFPDEEREELKNLNISTNLKTVILKMIEMHSEYRYKNMAELINDLSDSIRDKNILSIGNKRRGKEKRSKNNTVIVVTSLESTGKTTVAVNLAHELSTRKIYTIIIDTDVDKKDLYYHFNKDYIGCLSKIGQGNNHELAQKINKHLKVYSEHRDAECSISNASIMRLISDSKKISEAVIVDLANNLSEEIRKNVFLMADHVLFVTDQRVNQINRLSMNMTESLGGVEGIDLLINKYTDINFLDKHTILDLIKQRKSHVECKEGNGIEIGNVFSVKNDYAAILRGLAERKPAICTEDNLLNDDFRILSNYYFPNEAINNYGRTSLIKKLMGIK